MLRTTLTKRCILLLVSLLFALPAVAGGGYFALGYGPISRQMAGASTAVAQDAFAGSSNPAKLTAVDDRLDVNLDLFNPHRTIERTGSGTPFDFSSKSKNSLFVIPEFAYARRINERFSAGVTVYANGGLNSEYNDSTNLANTNNNPAACGAAPGNFFGGCHEAGFDLMQIIVAPTAAWKITPKHSLGISPLIAMQRYRAFGLQAFAPASLYPDSVTNRGFDTAYGSGVRVGWYGELTPWLTAGAAYSSKIYMQDFKKYKGLFAEGSFDIPANYSVGFAVKPNTAWLLALDIQRINFADVKALGNSLLNTLSNPVANPLGSSSGSGFGWNHNQTNYRLGLAYTFNPNLTLRGGFSYGRRAHDMNDINAVSFSVLTPNSLREASLGFTWKTDQGNELNLSIAQFIKGTYQGPSALFPGATESVTPYVNMLNLGWSWKL
jgi:long-chain fatty acid transport protein